jgi:ABC-type uncharacterized transport system auxiliary subunit
MQIKKESQMIIKRIIKSTAIGLTAIFLLTGCFDKQEQIKTPEVKHKTKVEDKSYHHVVKKKKKKKKVILKKKKVDLKKFCFKNNHSIHYRSSERCR